MIGNTNSSAGHNTTLINSNTLQVAPNSVYNCTSLTAPKSSLYLFTVNTTVNNVGTLASEYNFTAGYRIGSENYMELQQGFFVANTFQRVSACAVIWLDEGKIIYGTCVQRSSATQEVTQSISITSLP